MSVHELKVWPEFYQHLVSGEKTFELREDDRGFRAGDDLRLMEWSRDAGYTGREITRRVSYIVSGRFGLLPNYVCMALRATERQPGVE